MPSNDSADPIQHRDDAGVRVITLNRPERKNALDFPARAAVVAVIEDAHANSDVRAVIITGVGGSFCSGADVGSMGQQSEMATAVARIETMQAIIRGIVSGPTPIVAAVEGIAFGAGLGIALACDYVVAASNSRLSAAFVNVGLSGDAGILYTLPQRVGPARARAMMLQAQMVGGTEGLAIGLVDELCEPGQALETAKSIAAALAVRPPLAIQAIKKAFAEPPTNLMDALNLELVLQGPLLASNDYVEAVAAFKDKRTPTFTGT